MMSLRLTQDGAAFYILILLNELRFCYYFFMKNLPFTLIAGVITGILVAYFSEESLRGFLESNFFQTLALLSVGFLLYQILKNKKIRTDITLFVMPGNNTIKVLNMSRENV